jgi:hypothetical protein
LISRIGQKGPNHEGVEAGSLYVSVLLLKSLGTYAERMVFIGT